VVRMTSWTAAVRTTSWTAMAWRSPHRSELEELVDGRPTWGWRRWRYGCAGLCRREGMAGGVCRRRVGGRPGRSGSTPCRSGRRAAWLPGDRAAAGRRKKVGWGGAPSPVEGESEMGYTEEGGLGRKMRVGCWAC
jgi:hypothetical protein